MVLYKSFSGGLIGKNNSAYFLIGIQNDKFIYMDPHFIQEANDYHSIETQLASYNVSTFWTIKSDEINPSIGISFTVKSF